MVHGRQTKEGWTTIVLTEHQYENQEKVNVWGKDFYLFKQRIVLGIMNNFA